MSAVSDDAHSGTRALCRTRTCCPAERIPRHSRRNDTERWGESPDASYILCDTWSMADTITFRPDEDTARALEVLTSDGTPVSAAVRAALIAAARDRARASLRKEAEALAADEQDRAEAAQVLRDMETLRAW